MHLQQRENQQRGKRPAPDNFRVRNGFEPAGALRIVRRVRSCYGGHACEDSRYRTGERGESNGKRTLKRRHIHERGNAGLMRWKAIETDYPCQL